VLGCSSVANENAQFINRFRPQWTASSLVSLSVQKNGRSITIGYGTKVKVEDPYLRHLVSPSAGVVQE
jgi:hypothetical protein